MTDKDKAQNKPDVELGQLRESLCECSAALRSRNQDLDDIARYIVNEFRGPLGAVIGYAELLEVDLGNLPPDDLLGCIQTIKQSGHKLSEMVNVLLLLANSRRLFDNVWFAAYLTSMDESSLPHWAEELNAVEVYRFTCLPASSAPLVIRAWQSARETPSLLAIAKLGGESPPSPAHQVRWELEQDEWTELVEAVQATKFWDEDSSLDSLGWMRMVGTGGEEWIFEGWRNEQYKARAVWNPNQDKAHGAFALGRSFVDMLPGEFALEMARLWAQDSWSETEERLNHDLELGAVFES